MRDILFRGKRLDNGEWVEGFFVEKKYPILESDVRSAFILAQANGDSFVWFPVDQATVGQFTGLLDNQGKRIFDGDMIKPFDDEIDKMVVEFDHGQFLLCLYGERGYMAEYGWEEEGNYGVFESEPLSSYCDYIEVIGNIHDREFGGGRE